MGLPDLEGDEVATKLLSDNINLQIIVITADEKTTKRVNKTISTGVSAFIQKPFTLDEFKKLKECEGRITLRFEMFFELGGI